MEEMNKIIENDADFKGSEINGIVHIVKKGDSMYRLARIYGVKVADILKENPYVNVYNMQIGDEIIIPVMEN